MALSHLMMSLDLQRPNSRHKIFQGIRLARRVGKPTAARAVGMANHHNPLPIVIPCHRVVGKNGSLTGYAGGLDLKRYLLALESRQHILL